MRPLVDRDRLERLLRALGRACRAPTRAYLTGGATAVLHGWRPSTVDVDLVFVPDRDELLRAVKQLKDELRVNVELASPAHFIPELPGWEERSIFVTREGPLDVFHYDPYAQALSKVERDYDRDQQDVRAFIAHGLVEPSKARALFAAIEPQLHRYPALDADTFRAKVERAFSPGPAPPPSSTPP